MVAPPVTHLMFANDLMLFSTAEQSDVLCLKECLDMYEHWPEQKVLRE